MDAPELVPIAQHGVNPHEMGAITYTAPLNPSGTPTVADWCARGKSWLLAQFADKPIICDLLCAILDEVQEIEQAIADVREVHRDIDQAFGDSLDQIGLMLGYEREDQTDTEYRLELRAVARARTDNSSVPAVIRVFEILLGLGTFEQREIYPAHYRVFADNPLTYAFGGRAARIGRIAKPAAVGYDLTYAPSGFRIMSFDDDTVHTAVPFAERGVPSDIRMAERDAGK